MDKPEFCPMIAISRYDTSSLGQGKIKARLVAATGRYHWLGLRNWLICAYSNNWDQVGTNNSPSRAIIVEDPVLKWVDLNKGLGGPYLGSRLSLRHNGHGWAARVAVNLALGLRPNYGKG